MMVPSTYCGIDQTFPNILLIGQETITMPQRVALIHVPGWPLQERSLLPCGEMILTAGLLRASGTTVCMRDYATLSALSEPATAWINSRLEAGWWRRQRASREFHRIWLDWCQKIARHISEWGPNEVIFFAADNSAWHTARRTATFLLQLLPHTQIFGLGIRQPVSWPWKHWRTDDFLNGQQVSLPCALKNILPDNEFLSILAEEGKFSVVPLGAGQAGLHNPCDAAAFRHWLLRAAVQNRNGLAVWIREPVPAQELLQLCMSYFRRIPAAHAVTLYPDRNISPATVRILQGAGCRAVEILALSGSQRILEDVYRADFSVRDVRELAETCRAAGLKVLLRYAAPCCWDDRHTFDEARRLAEQCACAGISVAGDNCNERADQGSPSRKNLLAYLENTGIPTGLRGWHLVAAEAAGFSGREIWWLNRIRESLECSDIATLHTEIRNVREGLAHISAARQSVAVSRLEAVAN